VVLLPVLLLPRCGGVAGVVVLPVWWWWCCRCGGGGGVAGVVVVVLPVWWWWCCRCGGGGVAGVVVVVVVVVLPWWWCCRCGGGGVALRRAHTKTAPLLRRRGVVVVVWRVGAPRGVYRVSSTRPSVRSTDGASGNMNRSACARFAPRAVFSRRITATPAASRYRALFRT
jgi:hypothetical protein